MALLHIFVNGSLAIHITFESLMIKYLGLNFGSRCSLRHFFELTPIC